MSGVWGGGEGLGARVGLDGGRKERQWTLRCRALRCVVMLTVRQMRRKLQLCTYALECMGVLL